MRFTTSAIISLALVLSASASPIAANDPGVVVDTYADPVEKRDDGLICLNRGPEEKRGDVIARIDDYCARHQGWVVKDGYDFVEHQTLNGHPLNIGVGGKGGCEWTLGVECYYNLRKMVDECNTGGVNGKQGGLYGDQCAGYWLTFVDH